MLRLLNDDLSQTQTFWQMSRERSGPPRRARLAPPSRSPDVLSDDVARAAHSGAFTSTILELYNCGGGWGLQEEGRQETKISFSSDSLPCLVCL